VIDDGPVGGKAEAARDWWRSADRDAHSDERRELPQDARLWSVSFLGAHVCGNRRWKRTWASTGRSELWR
jgi:hypothetical protein